MSAPRRSSTQPQTVLAVASLGVFMAFVDATIVNIAFPNIERSFKGSSLSELSWVLNAYNIMFAALLVAAGRVADVLGRKRVFRFGLLMFTIASGACAIAPTPPLLILARVLQGMGAAVLIPCSLALVLQAFPEDRRGHAVAMWTATAALAAGVGPPLGGVLVAVSSWRLAFVANVPIGLLAYHLAGRALVESRVPGRRRLPDLAGGLVLAVGLGTLTFGIVKGPDWGWADVRVLAAFVLAAALLIAFVDRCRHHPVPVIDFELVRTRNVGLANSLMVLCGTGFFAYTLCNVLFLTSVWRYSVLHAGLAMTPGPFVAAAVARPVSELAERIGHRVVVAAGVLLWAAGLLWFIARVGPQPQFAAVWLPGMVLLGVGAGVAFPNASSVAVASAPGERFATATAINSVARQLGAVLGVAVLVAIIGTPGQANAAHAFRDGWWFGAGCFLVVAAGALALQNVSTVTVQSAAPVRPREQLIPHPASTNGRQLAHRPRVRTTASPAEFLRAAPLFSELPTAMLDSILSRATRLQLRAGEWLFRQGMPGDSLYLVRSGRLEAVREDEDGTSMATIERGAVVGELAVLARSTRAASIRALRDCELLKLTSDDFTALMANSAPLATALARTLSAQVQAGVRPSPARRPVPSTIALVPLHDDLPMESLCSAFGRALNTSGATPLLTRDCAGGTVVDDPLAAFAPIVDQSEAHHDHVLLLTGRPESPDAWTEFSLARADRIVGVTAGQPVPAWLADRPALHGCDLAGYGISPGSGALSPWIAALRPMAIHRLDAGDMQDSSVAVAARRLSGRSVGVVLSGGGRVRSPTSGCWRSCSAPDSRSIAWEGSAWARSSVRSWRLAEAWRRSTRRVTRNGSVAARSTTTRSLAGR